MIRTIEIENFKSIEKLKIEFGRVNLLIGENGCGKSAILEALTFAAAAESDRLDTEFLENRGIRVTAPEFMRAGFDQGSADKPIEIGVDLGDEDAGRLYIANHSNDTFGKWELKVDFLLRNTGDVIEGINDTSELVDNKKEREDRENWSSEEFKAELDRLHHDVMEAIDNLRKSIKTRNKELDNKLDILKSFVIYAPQNKQLRSLTEEGSIRPVGIYGEGLFKLLREIHKTQPEAIKDIDKGLSLIGWYRSMDLDNTPAHPEDELYIQDKFLSAPFTQRSANEGFLYVLFYMALMVSKDTPKIFAIDNIDAALNPKLCAKITSYLIELAKKYDKQIFLTTQNPATLDGLDLRDDEQKLLVVSRKRGGQTNVKPFSLERMPKNEHGEAVRLSEAMIRGYIGGVPKGF